MKSLVILSLCTLVKLTLVNLTLVNFSCIKTAPPPNFACEILLERTEREISKDFTKEDPDVVSSEFRILEATCKDGVATFFIQFSLVLEVPDDVKKEGAENVQGEALLEMKSYMENGKLVVEKGAAQILSFGSF